MSVELQVHSQPGTWKRMQYQNSRLFSDQLKAGAEYDKLRRAITIVVSEPLMFPDRQGYHFHFMMYDPVAQVRFPDSSEIHVLQITMISETDTSLLGGWLRLFRAKTTEEFEMAAEVHPEIEKAWEAIKFLSANPVARRLAEAQEMHRRDMVDRIEGGRQEGIVIGELRGALRERQETILLLLSRKMSYEEIADIYGLSVDEIRHLANPSPSQ